MLNNDNIHILMESQYFSINEVAETLRVSYLTVYRWVRLKKLKCIRAGKQYRIDKKDLEVFIKNEKN